MHQAIEQRTTSLISLYEKHKGSEIRNFSEYLTIVSIIYQYENQGLKDQSWISWLFGLLSSDSYVYFNHGPEPRYYLYIYRYLYRHIYFTFIWPIKFWLITPNLTFIHLLPCSFSFFFFYFSAWNKFIPFSTTPLRPQLQPQPLWISHTEGHKKIPSLLIKKREKRREKTSQCYSEGLIP